MPEPSPLRLGAEKAPGEYTRRDGKVTESKSALKLPKIYTAAELMAVKFPPPRWAVPGIVAHGLCLLGGMPKFGKSWWMLELGIAVACGGRAFGQLQVEQGEVLYLALEDDYESLQERLAMLLPDGRCPEGLFVVNEWPRMGKERGTTYLNEWLDQHPLCRLAMIDTLPGIRPLGGNARTLYDDDYQTATALKHVADRHKVALVASMHLTKLQRDDPFMGFNATLGLTGGSDQMIVLASGLSKHDATMHVKGRRVRWQDLAMKWDPVTAQWTLLGKADDYKRSKERQEIITVLKEAPLPLTPREMASILKKHQSTVRSLMWQMVRDGELTDTDGHYQVAGWANGVSKSGNLGNLGNRVAQVAQVAQVATVGGVAQTNAVLCVECDQALPEGWFMRCPLCEEKMMAGLESEVDG